MKSNTEPAEGQRIYLRKKAKNAPKLRPAGAPITVPKPPRPKPPTTRPTETETQPSTPTPSPTAKIHIVKSSDTLYNIARKYNITVETLKQLNGLTSNIIKIGQRLKVM